MSGYVDLEACAGCGRSDSYAPSPLAVPDTVRRLVWEVAGLVSDSVESVTWANGLVVVTMKRHLLEIGVTTLWWRLYFVGPDGRHLGYQEHAEDSLSAPFDRLAIEVEQWASGLVAQAVTDGDWGRP